MKLYTITNFGNLFETYKQSEVFVVQILHNHCTLVRFEDGHIVTHLK